ncbi:MAG: DUF3159 domain-containing protein [Bowdeniella nasicola]|nr:DUF3159 domain-containing protein [Bowdeniella nasicola]
MKTNPGGVHQIAAEEFDLRTAVGGPRGVLESIAPVLIFLAVFLPTHRVGLAAIAALVVASMLLAARLIARTPITQALGGFLGVVICALWAWYSGRAADYFVPGLWINALYAIAMLGSIAIGYPLIGLIDAMIRGDSNWRTGPYLPRYRWVTALWAAMFGLRLAVQWPLYATDNVAALGTARLIMGVPLMAATVFFSWLVLRRSHTNPREG